MQPSSTLDVFVTACLQSIMSKISICVVLLSPLSTALNAIAILTTIRLVMDSAKPQFALRLAQSILQSRAIRIL